MIWWKQSDKQVRLKRRRSCISDQIANAAIIAMTQFGASLVRDIDTKCSRNAKPNHKEETQNEEEHPDSKQPNKCHVGVHRHGVAGVVSANHHWLILVCHRMIKRVQCLVLQWLHIDVVRIQIAAVHVAILVIGVVLEHVEFFATRFLSQRREECLDCIAFFLLLDWLLLLHLLALLFLCLEQPFRRLRHRGHRRFHARMIHCALQSRRCQYFYWKCLEGGTQLLHRGDEVFSKFVEHMVIYQAPVNQFRSCHM
mmetsp:Transcript_37744/g.60473  ORF Transcript_37744/g.60473 Transcript_37744/m.60473 type:complete len:254 (+) Transcript_37744:168-929(+)